MAHASILHPEQTVLAVVDYQEAFRGFIDQFEAVTPAIINIIRGFSVLGLPVLVTEQYPKGLGHTIAEVIEVLPELTPVIEKTAFSSCGADPFEEHLRAAGAKQVLICGIETHICVSQTAHDLLDKGYQVHILTDAVGSRFPVNKEAGLEKMIASGAIPSSVEMALFELMRDSKHSCFRDIQAIIR
ncbi:MAG: hydrolase [Acidobacteria bacterium]|nr:MAG: hydrolase [Acidobacteriota bacterium]REK01330.1 MAG: hydrolase [Acidobacteriota bacterium]REK14286.1 MAG: hydrolase [Acidobacteriota bacterium]REK45001.1 MAG: hydrolase [Acidobacteriota bacterium]